MKSTEVELLDGSKQKVNEITYGEWKATRKESIDFDNNVALIRACTGLEVSDIDLLDTPNFNELFRACNGMNNPTTQPKAGASSVNISQPVMTIYGEQITEIKINMPKVTASRELSLIVNDTARMEYMIKSTTGIALIDSMLMSDYTLLVLAVPDFFAQGAAFFRQSK